MPLRIPQAPDGQRKRKVNILAPICLPYSHGQIMARIPRLSIAAKLYAIFALLATATVVLALVAVVNARRHAALTDEFEAALQGSQNVERINGLIYAVVMESRGVYMSADAPTGEEIRRRAARSSTSRSPRSSTPGSASVRPERRRRSSSRSPGASGSSSNSARSWRDSAPRSARAAGREWGDNDTNRTVRIALNKDLEMLGALYCQAGAGDLRQDRRRDRFHRLADERARRARGPARRGRGADPPARRGPSARRDHARDRTGRRGPRGCRSLRLAPRRDRRAVALDQRVPARHAPQQGAQPLDGHGDECARAPPGASVDRGRGLHHFDRDATSPSSAPSAIRCWSPPAILPRPPIAPRAAPKAPRPPRPRPPPTCATSRRRPMSLPRR